MRMSKLGKYFHLSIQQLFEFIVASELGASDGFDGYWQLGVGVGAFVYFSELALSDEMGDGVVVMCAFDGAGRLLHLNLTTHWPQ